MKQALQQRASQQLTMTPQLQLSLRLLQLSALEFEQEVEEALASNPFLERTDNVDEAAEAAGECTDGPGPAPPDETPAAAADTGAEADDFGPDEWGHAAHRDEGDEDAELGSYTATQTSLREHLLGQVRISKLSQRDQTLVAILVDALDECGYLRQPLDDLCALWRGDMEVTADEVTEDELSVALRFLQSLDPSGVGARSLAECLALQLAQIPAEVPGRTLAQAIVRDHLPLLAAHDPSSLQRVLHCDEAALRQANCLIKRLDPRPGLRYADDDTRYVVADVDVRKTKDKWVAAINPKVMPRLDVNRVYAEILRNGAAGSPRLGQQLQEARWLIRNVQQRFQTIQRVAQAIVDRQSRFFDYGEIAMKPLILRDIADKLGLHESTVSRVTSNKYMATPRGLIDFKYFFCSRVTTDDGKAYSATAIQALIKQIVAAEDARKPLSDIKIAKMLGVRGIAVARRTVSKYRDAMRIPPVNARLLSRPQPGVVSHVTGGR